MAWIKAIDENQAEGPLAEAYDNIKNRRGKLSNIMRAQSLNPAAMVAHMDLYLQLMFGNTGLRRELRELIGVVVSLTNHCGYCVNHHAEALNYYWKNKSRIEQLKQDYSSLDFPENTKVMLEYCVKLTLYPQSLDEADVNVLREVGFPEEDILNINLIVSYFNFVNRIVLGLGVELSPDEMSGYQY